MACWQQQNCLITLLYVRVPYGGISEVRRWMVCSEFTSCTWIGRLGYNCLLLNIPCFIWNIGKTIRTAPWPDHKHLASAHTNSPNQSIGDCVRYEMRFYSLINNIIPQEQEMYTLFSSLSTATWVGEFQENIWFDQQSLESKKCTFQFSSLFTVTWVREC